MAATAGDGVGSCGGGIFRAAFGRFGAPSLPAIAAIAAKVVLMSMPALAAAQWACRAVGLYRRLQSDWRRESRPQKLRTGEYLAPVLRRRLALSLCMCAAMTLLILVYASCELNAVNGPLLNLLTAALVGAHFESLLSVYDLRGRLRQFLFFALFMVL